MPEKNAIKSTKYLEYSDMFSTKTSILLIQKFNFSYCNNNHSTEQLTNTIISRSSLYLHNIPPVITFYIQS